MGKRRHKRMRGKFESITFHAAGQMHRQCVFCGETKPITDFARNGTNKEGKPEWRLDCKQCYNIRRKANSSKKKHHDFIGSQKRRGEAEPQLTHQEWKEALIFFDGECAYCGGTTRKGQRLTRDHLVPVSAGGETTQSNIVPACKTCNSSKGASELKEWFMKQPFFSQNRLNRIFKWRTILRQVEGNKE